MDHFFVFGTYILVTHFKSNWDKGMCASVVKRHFHMCKITMPYVVMHKPKPSQMLPFELYADNKLTLFPLALFPSA